MMFIVLSPNDHARRVIALTTRAWCVAPASPHEVARRAPYGHVPLRIARRLRTAAAAARFPLLAHSW